MRNSSSASSETRLLVPPKALVTGSCPAPPWLRLELLVPQVGAYSIDGEVVGIRPLAVHSELAPFVLIGRC